MANNMGSDDDKVFQQIIQDALPGKIISNFVLIAEVVDGNSQQTLSLFLSDGMTPWLARGMMESASDMVAEAEYGFGDDDDD